MSFTSHFVSDHLILAWGRRFSLAAIGAATCCSVGQSFELESGVGAAAAAALVVVRGGWEAKAGSSS